jgi:hypothetical protein
MKKIIFLFLIVHCTLNIDNCLSQWVQTTGTPEGSGITGMIVKGTDTIIVTTGSVSGGQQGGIRVSTNGGISWSNVLNGYIARCITAGAYGNYVSFWNFPFANEGIYYSPHTLAWGTVFNFPTTGNNIFSLLNPIDSVIFAGTRTGILRSLDFGVNFNYANNGIPANSWVLDIASDSSGIVGAATTNGVFISTNLGNSWMQTTGIPASDTITSIGFHTIATDKNTERVMYCFGYSIGNQNLVFEASENTTYLAAIIHGLIGENSYYEGHTISPATGAMEYTWLVSRPINPIQPGGGVYQSTNNCQSFTPLNEGLPNNPKGSSIVAVNNTTSRGNSVDLICGLFENSNNGAKVFKRTVPIGIQQISSEVPKGFSLSQNYPNPFNPNTKIKFQISKLSDAKLIVFDVLGREVTTLVNEQLKPGTYEVDWDGSGFASGVYYYKLSASTSLSTTYQETKRMVLMK